MPETLTLLTVVYFLIGALWWVLTVPEDLEDDTLLDACRTILLWPLDIYMMLFYYTQDGDDET